VFTEIKALLLDNSGLLTAVDIIFGDEHVWNRGRTANVFNSQNSMATTAASPTQAQAVQHSTSKCKHLSLTWTPMKLVVNGRNRKTSCSLDSNIFVSQALRIVLTLFTFTEKNKYENWSSHLKTFLQYSPKIMHAQELLFASASRQLLAATCGTLALEYCKPQELLCGKMSGLQVSSRTSLC